MPRLLTERGIHVHLPTETQAPLATETHAESAADMGRETTGQHPAGALGPAHRGRYFYSDFSQDAQ